MAYAPPIGFHLGVGGTADGITETLYIPLREAEKIPTAMSADDLGRALEVVLLGGRAAFRYTGDPFEVAPYWMNPQDGARYVFDALEARLLLSPEFDRRIWLTTMNEPDRSEAEWLGKFCYSFGLLMVDAKLRWLAPAWASGEPEPDDWAHFKDYLLLCEMYPDLLGVATHEYSFTTGVENVNEYAPWFYDRISFLKSYCDSVDISMPKIWIKEWGWEYQNVPDPQMALANIIDAWHSLYAKYPTIIGISIWYLGGGFGEIAKQAIKIMPGLANWLVNGNFTQGPIDPPPPILPNGDDEDLETFLKETWDDTIKVQIDCGVSLNPDAGLLIAINNFVHPLMGTNDYTIVHSEYSRLFQGDLIPVQTGESMLTGDRLNFFWFYGGEKILVSDGTGLVAIIKDGLTALAIGLETYPNDI